MEHFHGINRVFVFIVNTILICPLPLMMPFNPLAQIQATYWFGVMQGAAVAGITMYTMALYMYIVLSRYLSAEEAKFSVEVAKKKENC